jgi:hypothetical protein
MGKPVVILMTRVSSPFDMPLFDVAIRAGLGKSDVSDRRQGNTPLARFAVCPINRYGGLRQVD